MKIVKNVCFGGFSISPKAIKRLAELKGKECYFFKDYQILNIDPVDYEEITEEEAKGELLFRAFSVKDPGKYLSEKPLGEDGTHKEYNNAYIKINLDRKPRDRTDADLIQVIEELGADANGVCAELEIVEIPDGIEWEIDEYDGNETIREKHRTW